MNEYSLLVSLLLLIGCLVYCYYVEGVAAEDLIWHAIKMVLSTWTGRCCGALFCVLFSYGLCY